MKPTLEQLETRDAASSLAQIESQIQAAANVMLAPAVYAYDANPSPANAHLASEALVATVDAIKPLIVDLVVLENPADLAKVESFYNAFNAWTQAQN